MDPETDQKRWKLLPAGECIFLIRRRLPYRVFATMTIATANAWTVKSVAAASWEEMKLRSLAAAEAQARPPMIAVRFGRNEKPRRIMTIRSSDSGKERPRINIRQCSVPSGGIG